MFLLNHDEPSNEERRPQNKQDDKFSLKRTLSCKKDLDDFGPSTNEPTTLQLIKFLYPQNFTQKNRLCVVDIPSRTHLDLYLSLLHFLCINNNKEYTLHHFVVISNQTKSNTLIMASTTSHDHSPFLTLGHEDIENLALNPKVHKYASLRPSVETEKLKQHYKRNIPLNVSLQNIITMIKILNIFSCPFLIPKCKIFVSLMMIVACACRY